MWPVSSKFKDHVKQSKTIVHRVDCLQGDGKVGATLDVVDGELNYERASKIRSSGHLKAVDRTGVLTPRAADDLLQPAAAILKVYSGFKYPDGTGPEMVPMGVYCVDELDVSADSGLVVMDANILDLSGKGQSPIVNPFTISPQEGLESVITRLLLGAWGQYSFRLSSSGVKFPATVLDYRTIPWDTAYDYAVAAGLELYVARDGGVVTAPYTAVAADLAVLWEFKEGATADFEEPTRKLSVGKIPNGIIVIGTNAAAPNVRAEAWDSDPQSLTYKGGRYGQHAMIVESDKVVNNTQAQFVANTLLGKRLSVAEVAEFDASQNPALMEGDTVRVFRTRTGLEGRAMLVTNLKHPLTVDGKMHVVAQRSVLTADDILHPPPIVVTPPIPLPDLVVTDILTAPSPIQAGQEMSFQIVVKNQGTKTYDGVDVLTASMYADNTLVATLGGYNTPLAAGASVTISLNGGPDGNATWTSQEGVHTLHVDLDPSMAISELNKDNNSYEESVTVDAPPQVPDLFVDGNPGWNPPNPQTGQAITFSCPVGNKGTGPTVGGKLKVVSFQVDGAEVSRSDNQVAEIAQNGVLSLTANAAGDTRPVDFNFVAGAMITSPNVASFNASNKMTAKVKVRLPNWKPAANYELMTRQDGAGKRAFSWWISANDGKMRFAISLDGTQWQAQRVSNDISALLTAGQTYGLAVEFMGDIAPYQVNFYYSEDYEPSPGMQDPSTWILINSVTVAGSGVASMFAPVSPLKIGGGDAGGTFIGKMYGWELIKNYLYPRTPPTPAQIPSFYPIVSVNIKSVSALPYTDPLTFVWSSTGAQPVTLTLGGGRLATWTPPAAGTYNVRAVVDPDNLITESAKDNNFKDIVMTVNSPQPSLPDLIIADPPTIITAVPADGWHAGDRVQFSALGKNQGGGATPQGTGTPGNHRVGWWWNGALKTWSDTNNGPMAPGAVLKFDANGGMEGSGLATLTEGILDVTAQIDAVKLIAEANEDNNTSPALRITVGPARSVGTREAKLFPWPDDSFINRPANDGVTVANGSFENYSVAGSGDIFRTQSYGTTVYGGGYAVLNQTDPENHRTYIGRDAPNLQPGTGDLTTADEGYARQGSSYYNDSVGIFSLKRSLPWYYGMGAWKLPHAVGIIRDADIASGAIMHRTVIWLLAGDLYADLPHGTGGAGTGWVWPAVGQDGDANNGAPLQQYAGGIPIGAWMLIPRTTANNMTTPEGNMLWHCLQDWGAHVCNRTGNRTFQSEATTRCNTFRTNIINSGDAGRCLAALRMVKRNICTPASPGGPGNPVIVYNRPPFAY